VDSYEEKGSDESVKKDPPKLKQLDITKGNVVIEVCDPITKEEKFAKHTLYKIKGSDQDGLFEVLRRYSDFDRIRSILVSRWPGVFIPPLPPKKTVNNMDAKFIEERRKALDQFCKNIAQKPSLQNSEEFQVFIKSKNTEVEKLLSIFQKFNVEDTISKYLTYFPYLENKGEISKDIAKNITNFKLYLIKTKGYLENIKKNSKSISSAKKHFYNQLSIFQEQVCAQYEKVAYSQYHGNKEEKNVFSEANNIKFTNAVSKLKEPSLPSYETIHEYIDEETKEIEALLEAIEQKDRIESLEKKARDKERSASEDLNKVLAGKKTMKTLLSKKSKEEEVAEFEKTIANAAMDGENLSKLVDMITTILWDEEISQFKTKKMSEYFRVIETGAQNELINLNRVSEYWETILENSNIKELSEK